MALIDIQREHALSLEDAQGVADELAQDLSKEFSIDYGWEDDVLYFERMGVHGQIEVDEKTIQIKANLGFLLLALKGRIEDEINEVLDRRFSS